MVELLQQGPYAPLSLAEQIISLFLGVRGYLDHVQIDQIDRFVRECLQNIKEGKPELWSFLEKEKILTSDVQSELVVLCDAFVQSFS